MNMIRELAMKDNEKRTIKVKRRKIMTEREKEAYG